MSEFQSYDGTNAAGVRTAFEEPKRTRGGLRGARISQVLSEARASLIEPSRPFTPASLEERAQNSLDGALNRALDREISRTSSAASNSNSSSRRGSAAAVDIWVNDAFGNSDISNSAYLDMSTVEPLSNYDSFNLSSKNGILVQNMRNSLNSSRDFNLGVSSLRSSHDRETDKERHSTNRKDRLQLNSTESEDWQDNLLTGFNSGGYGGDACSIVEADASLSDAAPSTEHGSTDDSVAASIGMMFHDIDDAISTLETQMNGISSGTSSGHDSVVQGVLRALVQPIDQLAKCVRNPRHINTTSKPKAEEAENARKMLTKALLRLLQIDPTNQRSALSAPTRELTCRHLLRLYVAHLQRANGTLDASNTPVSVIQKAVLRRAPSVDTLRGVQRTCRTLYEIVSKTKSKHDHDAAEEDSAMIDGGFQLILDLINFTWEYILQEVPLAMRPTGPPSVPATGVSSHPIALLFEAVTFAVGILRIHTTDNMGRRRLLHLGAIESAARGFVVLGAAAQLTTVHTSSNISNNTNALAKHLAEQVGRVAEQLVGAQRNFIQDSAGRARALKCNMLGPLCALLVPLGQQPELVLNIARITAKLSLLDTFRTQINENIDNVKALVSLITQEANKCHNLMTGRTDNAGTAVDSSHVAAVQTEQGAWPQWHTWPLLSRVSFTLGNLTTSNDRNRTIIGLQCQCIKHLVILLQACACSLSELLRASDESFSAGEEADQEESFEYEDVGSPAASPDRRQTQMEEPDERSPTISGTNAAAAEGGANPAEQELIDATVKLLRLLANLCIETDIGTSVAYRVDACEMLNELLVTCNQHSSAHQQNAQDQHAELLLNVVATCTNVTYYACHKQAASATSATEEIPKRLQNTLLAMSNHLSQCLFHSNKEIVLETARALGNLTRLPNVLSSLSTHRTDEALILLLSEKNMDIVTAVTGAVINLSASPHCRPLLMQDGNAVHALVAALRRSSLRNLTASTLICQALHNLISGTKNISSQQTAGRIAKYSTEDISAAHAPGLQETLAELVDLAAELSETSDQYTAFVNVGRAVQSLLDH